MTKSGRLKFHYPLLSVAILGVVCAVLWCVIGRPVAARQKASEPARVRYYVELELDYRNASYSGRETVRWVNQSRDEVDNLNFAIYPNWGLTETDPTLLAIRSVKLGNKDVRFSLRARGAWLRVELPRKVSPGQSVELNLTFTAQVPRVSRDETGLYAHFLQEISDATSDDKQLRDARDVFFASDGAMLLGYGFPLLTTIESPSNETGGVIGASNAFICDVGDFEVHVNADEKLQAFSSGQPAETAATKLLNILKISTRWFSFRGERLRGFALVLGDGWKVAEKQVGETRLLSYYREADERLGKRVLDYGVQAVGAYEQAFGRYPHPQIKIIELPLAAGYSSIELPGVVGMAQAYYVDFDNAQAVRLPGIVREQSDVIKAALEYSLVLSLAKQWWGNTVSCDSQRTPYLEEALASFSAVWYHEALYGKQLGKLVTDQQLRGAYQLYRLFGGNDLEVERPAKEYRSSLQYSAIAQAKAALLLVALREAMGDAKFFSALQAFYTAYQFEVVTPEYLKYAFLTNASEPRDVRVLFQRWWREKHGDEDIGLTDDLNTLSTGAPPAQPLATAPSTPQQLSKMRSLGRLLLRIGRSAKKPF